MNRIITFILFTVATVIVTTFTYLGFKNDTTISRAVLILDSRTVTEMKLPSVVSVGDTISVSYNIHSEEYSFEQRHTKYNDKALIIK